MTACLCKRQTMIKLLKHRKIRKLRYFFLRAATHAAVDATGVIPRRAGLALFGTIGSLVYLIPHDERKLTKDHLTMIFGHEWDKEKIDRTAAAVYRELGKNIFDAFYLPRLAPADFNRIVTHDPLDAVESEYRKGRGGIVITAHTGCFEMLLHFFPKHGFKSFAVGRKLHDEGLDRIIRRIRSGEDIVYMDRSEAVRKIIRLLQEGRLFGVLVDQDTSVEGVFADFLGRKAFTPSGPLKIAMKFNVPVFVATTARQNGDKHHVFITGPLNLRRNGDFESDLVFNAATVNGIICETIKRYPEQWVWMHRRWRRQPLGAGVPAAVEV